MCALVLLVIDTGSLHLVPIHSVLFARFAKAKSDTLLHSSAHRNWRPSMLCCWI